MVAHPMRYNVRLQQLENGKNIREFERSIPASYKNREQNNRTRRRSSITAAWLLGMTLRVAKEKQLHALNVEILHAEKKKITKQSIIKLSGILRNIKMMHSTVEEESSAMSDYERVNRLVTQLQHLFSVLQFLKTVNQEVENRRSL